MTGVVITTTWLLIAFAGIGAGSSSVVAEFNSEKDCQRVLQELRQKWHTADGICVPKTGD